MKKQRAYCGDNLEIMKALQSKSIDLMLWDPPYNTQRTDMVYDDKISTYAWLCFMEERLLEAKRLLKVAGIIAVHISHHELFALGILMDETFGKRNRVSLITWECTYSPKNCKRTISSTSDYILLYAVNFKKCYAGTLERTEIMNRRYKFHDKEGYFDMDSYEAPAGKSSNCIFAIENPFNKKLYYPSPGRAWRSNIQTTKAYLEEWGLEWLVTDKGLEVANDAHRYIAHERLARGLQSTLAFGKDGSCGPRYKRYLHKLKREGYIPGNYWKYETINDAQPWRWEDNSHNNQARKEIKEVVPALAPFSTPKPLKLLMRLIKLFCPKGGVVLDAFAGSGTTGHALMQLNSEGAQRTCILIEQDKEIFKDVLQERITRVKTGDWAFPKKDTVPLGIYEWEFIN